MKTFESKTSRRVVINDLLCFVQNNIRTLGAPSVQRLCMETYVLENIQEAFEILRNNMKMSGESLEADCSISLENGKENMLKKICDLFENKNTTLYQFASSGCNMPRMGMYRDTLSIACLWDDVRELKQIIMEQNRLLANDLHCLYEEFISFKKRQEKLKNEVCVNETTETIVSLPDFMKDKSVELPAASSLSREEASEDAVQCYVTSAGNSPVEEVTPHTFTKTLDPGDLGFQVRDGVAVSKTFPRISKTFERRVSSKKDHRFATKQQLISGKLNAKNVCEICGYTGNTTDVTRHRRTHTGERPFSCPMCSVAFSLRGNMLKHLARKHGTYLSKIPSKRGHRSKAVSKVYPPTRQLALSPDHHSRKESSVISVEVSASNHQDIVSLPPNLSLPGMLDIKEESILENFSVFPVPGNDIATMTTRTLATDGTEAEEQSKDRSMGDLSMMGEVARSSSAVATYNPMLHMQVGSGLVDARSGGRQGVRKRHSCEVCGYSGNLTDVTRHKRTHTGERPFACPICDVRFTLRGNMIKHMSRKHGT